MYTAESLAATWPALYIEVSSGLPIVRAVSKAAMTRPVRSSLTRNGAAAGSRLSVTANGERAPT
jgi:hypothetical protein